MHERFRIGATEIGSDAIASSLSRGGYTPEDIDCLIVASCTGYLCPGLTSVYGKEMGFRRNIQRADLVGMGCAGAMPALQRGYDFVKANPGKRALVVAVEICSACYYIDDTLETIVGNAICGDGAAAVVVGPRSEAVRPAIVGFETHLEPSFIGSVGFEHRDGRLRIVLSKDLRNLAGGMACQVVQQILGTYQLKKGDISHWVIHSGGRKVIDGIQTEIGLTDQQIRHSRNVLRNFGNMSSPTVLYVLEEVMYPPDDSASPRDGDFGIMLALGPGLAVEGALLQW